MVYSASKMTSYSSSITNQPSGGGSKKAGFPKQIGRDHWMSIAIKSCNPEVGGNMKCCALQQLAIPAISHVSQSRPIGRNYNVAYWH
jgi:hypothetical protein